MGRPAVVKPEGTEMAGSPKTANEAVLRGYTMVGLAACAMVTGGLTTVGKIRRSTLANNLPISRRNISSWRRASRYVDAFISVEFSPRTPALFGVRRRPRVAA